MSTPGNNKIITVPEATDLVSRAVLTGALQLLEDCVAHGIAVQANSSTTAYTASFPFQEYYTGIRITFIPLYANTGAVTLNLNSLGAKKVVDTGGSQITAAGAIVPNRPVILAYDSTLDSGAGAFKMYVPFVDTTTVQSISGQKTFNDPIVAGDTVDPISGAKFRITPEGGVAVKLTNKSGAASTKGLHVIASPTTDNAFAICGASVFYGGIGFEYESGVADGSEMSVVISGIAEVLMASTKAATRGQYCVLSSEDGKSESKAAIADNDVVLGMFITSCAAGGTAKIVMMDSRQ